MAVGFFPRHRSLKYGFSRLPLNPVMGKGRAYEFFRQGADIDPTVQVRLQAPGILQTEFSNKQPADFHPLGEWKRLQGRGDWLFHSCNY